MKPLQRLFVLDDLLVGSQVALNSGQAHYLANVLRLPVGGDVLVFNGRDGEWIAHLSSTSKKGGGLVCARQARPQVTVPDLWLLFAPVKEIGRAHV